MLNQISGVLLWVDEVSLISPLSYRYLQPYFNLQYYEWNKTHVIYFLVSGLT